jgi:xylulokinase
VVRAAAGVAPGAEGVVFLPHLQGERAPLWDADARGVLVGLRADHGPAPVGRAVLEGVACSARHLLEAIEAAAGAPVPALRASGGAARSDVWCQIKADVLGRPLHRLRVIDSGALGAALLAGVGAGLLPDLAGAAREMVHVERTFAPDERNREGYDALYGVYREAQAALMPVFGSLARLPQTRTA